MAFPASPTNGQIYSVGLKSFRYASARTRWESNGNSVPMVWVTSTVNRILSSADEDGGLIFNSSSPLTVTLNPNATTPYTIGRSTLIENKGTGTVTIVLGTGVIGNKKASVSLVLNGQYAQVSVSKSATDEWEIAGDLL